MNFHFYIPWKIKNIYYSIRDFIFPRQFWLIKKLWGSHKDKDLIIEITILECIKNFVEIEKGGLSGLYDSKNEWADCYPDWQIKFEQELKDVYLIITKTLPDLEKKLEETWKAVPKFDFKSLQNSTKEDYDRKYSKIDRLESEINSLKTDILIWACRNRNSLWT